jgi:hypothetical protein
MMTKLSLSRHFALVFVLVSASMATAGMLTPNPANGNPHSAGPVNNFVVSLIPDPAIYLAPNVGSPWLIPAAQAAAQPYNNATNVWNFMYAAAFNGTFNMTQYAATNDGTLGGADFNINYTPGMGDPTGNNVRWMQVIDTNMPSARGTTYGVTGTGANGIPAGTTAYLDNAGPGNNQDGTGAPIDPYYGWLTATNITDITTSTAANSTHFSDTPALPLVNGRNWQAAAFVSSESDTVAGGITTHNVTIYGGVQWGFQDTAPEPSTFMLLATGGIIGFLGYKRRRRRQLK